MNELRPGQRVQAQVDEAVHWAGTVEMVAREMSVIWIREDCVGERKLVDLEEYQVFLQEPDAM